MYFRRNAGGLLNTHYYGRAADIREVNGESIRNNGNDPDVLSIGESLAGIPPDQRPDQIIGPRAGPKPSIARAKRVGSWTKTS